MTDINTKWATTKCVLRPRWSDSVAEFLVRLGHTSTYNPLEVLQIMRYQSINQSINLYFRHWTHRTIKKHKSNTVKRQRETERMQQYIT